MSSPWPFKTKSLAENTYNTLRFGIERPSAVLRYLTAKIVHSDDELTVEDTAIYFIVFEKLVEQSAVDEKMRQKYGFLLFLVRTIAQSLDSLQQMTVHERHKATKELVGLLERQNVTRRYYYSVKGQNERNWYILVETRRAKRFPQKAYVGKGYGDNGSAKDLAKDASPGWQEVAMSTFGLTQLDLPSRTERSNRLFAELRCHSQQLMRKDPEAILWRKGHEGD